MDRRANIDKEAAFEKSASWEDVRAKAQAIVDNGGVEIYEDSATQVGAYVMSGVIDGIFPVGDGGPYEVILSKRSWENKENVGGWVQAFLCDCTWGSYHSGRPGAGYSGRFCSHAMATLISSNARAKSDFMGDRIASASDVYDENNFYEGTRSTWYPCNAPDAEPDFVSESGSMYWHYPEGVVRGADHWGDDIGDCNWHMLGDEHESSYDDPCLDVRYGFCPWQCFEENLESDMTRTAKDVGRWEIHGDVARICLEIGDGYEYEIYGNVNGINWSIDKTSDEGLETLASGVSENNIKAIIECGDAAVELGLLDLEDVVADKMAQEGQWEFFGNKAVREYDDEWVGWAFDDGRWELFSNHGTPGDKGVADDIYDACHVCDMAALDFGAEVGGVAVVVGEKMASEWVNDGNEWNKTYDDGTRGLIYRYEDSYMVDFWPSDGSGLRTFECYDFVTAQALCDDIHMKFEVDPEYTSDYLKLYTHSLASRNTKMSYAYASYDENSRWVCYEPGFEGEYDLDSLRDIYSETVDHDEYPEFSDWEWDATRSGWLSRIASVGDGDRFMYNDSDHQGDSYSPWDDLSGMYEVVDASDYPRYVKVKRVDGGGENVGTSGIFNFDEQIESGDIQMITASKLKFSRMQPKLIAQGTDEYSILEELADELNRMRPECSFYVGETYFDFGQDWKWTTILCERDGDTWQAVTPVEWSHVLETGDVDTIAAEVLTGDYSELYATRLAEVDFDKVNRMVEFGVDLYRNQFKSWQSLVDIQEDEDVIFYKDGLDMTEEEWREGCRRLWEEIFTTASKKADVDWELEYGDTWTRFYDDGFLGTVAPEPWDDPTMGASYVLSDSMEMVVSCGDAINTDDAKRLCDIAHDELGITRAATKEMLASTWKSPYQVGDTFSAGGRTFEVYRAENGYETRSIDDFCPPSWYARTRLPNGMWLHLVNGGFAGKLWAVSESDSYGDGECLEARSSDAGPDPSTFSYTDSGNWPSAWNGFFGGTTLDDIVEDFEMNSSFARDAGRIAAFSNMESSGDGSASEWDYDNPEPGVSYKDLPDGGEFQIYEYDGRFDAYIQWPDLASVSSMQLGEGPFDTFEEAEAWCEKAYNSPTRGAKRVVAHGGIWATNNNDGFAVSYITYDDECSAKANEYGDWFVYDDAGETLGSGTEKDLDSARAAADEWHETNCRQAARALFANSVFVNVNDMSLDGDGYKTTLTDGAGNPLELQVTLWENGWDWLLMDEDRNLIADSDTNTWSTAQEALDDFNDWCDFNVNGCKVADGKIASLDWEAQMSADDGDLFVADWNGLEFWCGTNGAEDMCFWVQYPDSGEPIDGTWVCEDDNGDVLSWADSLAEQYISGERRISGKVADETDSGISYEVREDIDDSWQDYDRMVAQCHLDNFGVVFTDSYGQPIDDEYDLEEIFEDYGKDKSGSRKFASSDTYEDLVYIGDEMCEIKTQVDNSDYDVWIVEVSVESFGDGIGSGDSLRDAAEEALTQSGAFQSMSDSEFEDYMEQLEYCVNEDMELSASRRTASVDDWHVEGHEYRREYGEGRYGALYGTVEAIVGFTLYDGDTIVAQGGTGSDLSGDMATCDEQARIYMENGNGWYPMASRKVAGVDGVDFIKDMDGMPCYVGDNVYNEDNGYTFTIVEVLNPHEAIVEYDGVLFEPIDQYASGHFGDNFRLASRRASGWEPFDGNVTVELGILDEDEILEMYGAYTDESYIKRGGVIGVVSHHVGQTGDWWTWDTYLGSMSTGLDCGICQSKEEAMSACDNSMANSWMFASRKITSENINELIEDTVNKILSGEMNMQELNELVEERFDNDSTREKFIDCVMAIWRVEKYGKKAYTEPGQPREKSFDSEVVLPAIIDVWNLLDEYGVDDDSYEQVGNTVYMDEGAWNEMLSKMNNPAWAERFINYTPMSGGSPMLSSRTASVWEYDEVRGWTIDFGDGYEGVSGHGDSDGFYWEIRKDGDVVEQSDGDCGSPDQAKSECSETFRSKYASRKTAYLTPSGIFYNVVNDIQPQWVGYDYSVASAQLSNYDCVFVDEWGEPIDDEYALDDIAADFVSRPESHEIVGAANSDWEDYPYGDGEWKLFENSYAVVSRIPDEYATSDEQWGCQIFTYGGDKIDECSRCNGEAGAKAVAEERAVTSKRASVKEATRQFTYAEMKELEDEIEGTELKNADRFKDGGAAYYAAI